MKSRLGLIILLMMTSSAFSQISFKQNQLKFERVKIAYQERWVSLQQELTKQGFNRNFNLYLAAFKEEEKLEVWMKSPSQTQYKLFKTYNFCANSGHPGPKVKEGDLQIPEGFYHIMVFNPQSSFYLSVGINYPNTIDKLRSGKQPAGSDIYIHGDCVTIGCIPLDDEIKELYILAVEAKNNGQIKIPVHIFPFKMTDQKLQKRLKEFSSLRSFWSNLQQGYNYFETHRSPPLITEQRGVYLFK